MQVTNLLNIPLEVFQFMNNAIAGGVVVPSVTGGVRTTGGFAVATASNDGRCTVTWSAYSGTPVLFAQAIGADTNASFCSYVNPAGVGVSSAALVFAAFTNSGGSIATNSAFSAMVYLFGNNTGTRIS